MSYYIGLSILSNHGGSEHKKHLSREARRVLSMLEVDAGGMEIDGNGRPFLPGRKADFNISHSGNIAAVSLINGENLRTGCDVELIRPRKKIKEIAKNLFSFSERGYIFNAEDVDIQKFYEIWTLKECYLKLKGLSVFDMKNAPSFITDGQFAFGAEVSLPLSFNLCELSDGAGERYILASGVEGIENAEPEIRWFSHSLPVCRSIVKIKAAPSPADTVSPKM